MGEVMLPAIEHLTAGSMERLQRVDDVVNALIPLDLLRRDLLATSDSSARSEPAD